MLSTTYICTAAAFVKRSGVVGTSCYNPETPSLYAATWDALPVCLSDVDWLAPQLPQVSHAKALLLLSQTPRPFAGEALVHLLQVCDISGAAPHIALL